MFGLLHDRKGIKTVGGVNYYFVTNTDPKDSMHQMFSKVKDENKIRVLFLKAFDMLERPVEGYVAIWVAEDDRELSDEIIRKDMSL